MAAKQTKQNLDGLSEPALAKMLEVRMRETKMVPHEEVMAKAKAIISKHKKKLKQTKSGRQESAIPVKVMKQMETPEFQAFLRRRSRGKTISHEEVKASMQAILDQTNKKP